MSPVAGLSARDPRGVRPRRHRRPARVRGLPAPQTGASRRYALPLRLRCLRRRRAGRGGHPAVEIAESRVLPFETALPLLSGPVRRRVRAAWSPSRCATSKTDVRWRASVLDDVRAAETVVLVVAERLRQPANVAANVRDVLAAHPGTPSRVGCHSAFTWPVHTSVIADR